MIEIRKAKDRGHTKIDWLDSYHSFSFGEYYDPDNMGFGYLRVINDDRIKPGMGFGSHPHRDMEIITYMVEGELKHKDSMGNGSVIKNGDIQKMTAGKGIIHSELNNSDTEEAHLLQIWITPDRNGLTPSYEQVNIEDIGSSGSFRLIASGSNVAQKRTIKVNQKVNLYLGNLNEGQENQFNTELSGNIWVQVVKGNIVINDTELGPGDGAQITQTDKLNIKAKDVSEVKMNNIDIEKFRKTEYPVSDIFVNRWSPRAMSGESVKKEDLMSLFEAARWAPSSFNNQSWRFLYSLKNTESWDTFFDLLLGP